MNSIGEDDMGKDGSVFHVEGSFFLVMDEGSDDISGRRSAVN
jgi:hypothetical protein